MTTIIMLGSINTASANDDKISDTIIFAGFDVREKDRYPYAGLIHHVDGDMFSDGPLLRVSGYVADYEYSSAAVAGGVVDGDSISFTAMIGYQKILEEASIKGYVGVDYVKHDLSPNNTLDSNEGAHVGAKFQLDAETDYALPHYGGLSTSYSTATEKYYARARGGRNFEGTVFGLEGAILGNRESDEHRLGVFASSRNLEPITVSGAVGYSETRESSGGKSAYLNVEVSKSF